MPTRIKLRIFEARCLPVMGSSSRSTDAYVEIKLSNIFNEKTEVIHKSLDPKWDQAFLIEVAHDRDIQKHPLELKVWDRDILSSDQPIGAIYLDLNNLLVKESTNMSGWFPIFDTFRGVRGELRVFVSVEFFGKMTGVGSETTGAVIFMHSHTIYQNMVIKDVYGFVEELLLDEDPEYDWKDSFRASRTTNDARQYLLYKLSMKLRRQIGAKVREMDGNAVVGYHQHIEFETEGCVVARGYGTAVSLKQIRQTHPPLLGLQHDLSLNSGAVGVNACGSNEASYFRKFSSGQNMYSGGTGGNFLSFGTSMESEGTGGQLSNSSYSVVLTVDTSEEDESIHSTLPSSTSHHLHQYYRSKLKKSHKAAKESHFSVLNMHSTSVQFLTMHSLPYPVVVHVASVLSSRSIKLIPKSNRNEDKDRTVRDKWWSELRQEIRNHAAYLQCHYVLGYQETTTIHDDIIILTACGTAVNLKVPKNVCHLPAPAEAVHENTCPNTSPNRRYSKELAMPISSNRTNKSIPISNNKKPNRRNDHAGHPSSSEFPEKHYCQFKILNACVFCHVPYKPSRAPFPVHLSKCRLCERKLVPEILLATIDPPPGIAMIGQGQLIEACVCKLKKRGDREFSACQIAELIPFLEYDIHKQIILKLKILGMNACFRLRIQIQFNDTMIFGYAQGTAVRLAALPRPKPICYREQGYSHKHQALLQKLVQISEENTKLIDSQNLYIFQDSYLPPEASVQLSLLCQKEHSEHSKEASLHSNHNSEELYEDLTFDEPSQPKSNSLNHRSCNININDKLNDDFLHSLVTEFETPRSPVFTNTQLPLVDFNYTYKIIQNIVSIRLVNLIPTRSQLKLNRAIAKIFRSFYAYLCYRLSSFLVSHVLGVNLDVQISDDDLKISFIGMAPYRTQDMQSSSEKNEHCFSFNSSSEQPLSTDGSKKKSGCASEFSLYPQSQMKQDLSKALAKKISTISKHYVNMNRIETRKFSADKRDSRLLKQKLSDSSAGRANNAEDSFSSLKYFTHSTQTTLSDRNRQPFLFFTNSHPYVEITSLNCTPGKVVDKFLGTIHLSFIKETSALKEIGGMHVFIQNFIFEVQKIAKSHVLALGGNALTSFELGISQKSSKNRAYCLMILTGDALLVSSGAKPD